ncbi:MAG TPA: VOC family protein [Zeimonas sp.]|nr:VOC family protein [Zeimonas sp.]
MNTIEVLERPVHIHPRRLCHANMFVSDLRRSLDFYHRVCGLEVVLEQPEINAGFLSNGNTHHDIGMLQVTSKPVFGEQGHRILAANQGSEPGLYHFGWEMESEFELVRAHERLVAAGYRIWRTVRHRASHSVYLFDPDGNVHEFYADVERDWRTLYEKGTTLSGQWDPDVSRATTDARYDPDPEIRRVADAPVHPLRFSHAAMVVRNFENMQRFYANVVGLFEVFRSDDGSVVAYGSRAGVHPFTMAIVGAAADEARPRKSIHHIAFQVSAADDVDRAEAAFRERGVPVEHSVDTPAKRSVFIRDPDGVPVEFCHARAGWSPQVAMGGSRDARFL